MSEHPERWLSELYRASAREEPPRSLDAAILDAARKRSAGWLSRLMTNWQAPLAAAAVIVIAVTVVIAVHEDPAYTEQSTLRGNDSKSAAEAKETPSSSAGSLSDLRAPPASSERQALAEPKRQTATNRAQSGAEQASAIAEKEDQKKITATAEAGKSEASEPDAGTPLAAAVPAAPPRPAAPALERVPDVPGSVRENAPAQSAPPPPEAKVLGKLSSATEPEVERRARSTPDSNQAPYLMRQDASSREGARRAESRAMDQTAAPEVWLENILKLRNDGRHAEAKESLAAFKKKHPDYPLPSVLKDL